MSDIKGIKSMKESGIVRKVDTWKNCNTEGNKKYNVYKGRRSFRLRKAIYM